MSETFDLANKHLESGELELAERNFRRAAAEASSRDDMHLHYKCVDALKGLAIQRDDIHAALRWLKKLLSLHRDVGDAKGQISACLQISDLLFLRDDINEAMTWATKALHMAEAEWSRTQMAESLHLIGLLSIKNEVFDDAVTALRRAQDIWEERRDENGYYDSTFHLGLALHLQNDLSSAAREYRNCLKFLDDEEVDRQADLHLRLAAIGVDTTVWPDCLTHALAALGRYRKLESKRQSIALEILSRAQRLMGDGPFKSELQKRLNGESLSEFIEMLESHNIAEKTEIYAPPADEEPELAVQDLAVDEKLPTLPEITIGEAKPDYRQIEVEEAHYEDEPGYDDSSYQEPTSPEPPAYSTQIPSFPIQTDESILESSYEESQYEDSLEDDSNYDEPIYRVKTLSVYPEPELDRLTAPSVAVAEFESEEIELEEDLEEEELPFKARSPQPIEPSFSFDDPELERSASLEIGWQQLPEAEPERINIRNFVFTMFGSFFVFLIFLLAIKNC